MQNSTPIILDIEASGFGNGSYPIEVGFVLPNRNAHCYLIRPEPDWTHWDDGAEQVHGIRRELLLKKGLPVAEIAAQLNRHLHGLTVYSDGWGYDMSWISLLFDRAGISQTFQIETLVNLLSDHQLRRWEKTRRDVIEELQVRRHRASTDALILQETYLRTRNTETVPR